MSQTISRAQELTAQFYAIHDAIEENEKSFEYHMTLGRRYEAQQNAGTLHILKQHLQIVRRNMQS